MYVFFIEGGGRSEEGGREGGREGSYIINLRPSNFDRPFSCMVDLVDLEV